MGCLKVIKTEAYTHKDGNTSYIYVGRSWTYRVSLNSGKTSSDELVYISYTGSEVVNGTHFNGPSKVTIRAGKSYVDFEVYIVRHNASYHKFLNITASSQHRTSCGAARHQILSKKSTPTGGDEYQPPTYESCDDCDPHCCDFFDKNYKGWEETETKGCHDFFRDTPMLF